MGRIFQISVFACIQAWNTYIHTYIIDELRLKIVESINPGSFFLFPQWFETLTIHGFSQNAPFFGDVLDKWKSLRLKLVLHLRSGNLSNLQRATGGVDVSFAVGNRQAQVSPKKQVLVEPKNVIFQKDCLIFLIFVFYFHVDIIILAWCSSISFAIDYDLSRQYGALAMGIQGIAKCLGLEKQSECYQSVTSGKNNHFQFLYIGPLKHHISNKHVFSVVLTDFFF